MKAQEEIMALLSSIFNQSGKNSFDFGLYNFGKKTPKASEDEDEDEDEDEEEDVVNNNLEEPEEKYHKVKLRSFSIKMKGQLKVYVHLGVSARDLNLTISRDRRGFQVKNAAHSKKRFNFSYKCPQEGQYYSSTYDRGVLCVKFETELQSINQRRDSNSFSHF